MNLYFLFYVFFSSVISFFIIRKHLFINLVSLEFLVISLLLSIFFICLMIGYRFYIYVICMVFFVCEGVLGLRVLVRIIRFHRNDYLNSLMLW